MRILLYLFACLVAIQCTGVSGQADAHRSVLSQNENEKTAADTLVERYVEFIEQEIMPKAPPGAALAIVHNGEVVLAKGFGEKEYNSGALVDEHTIFRIGSLSKGFAGVLTGLLVNEGKMKWDTRVREYFPEFRLRSRTQSARMQVKHLLSHTTGLPYHAYSNLIERGKSVREINRYFRRVRLYAKEGTYYSYQNAAFSVVEEVMKGLTGKSYEQLLHEKIFYPAGMHDASSSFIDLQTASNKALPHKGGNGYWSPTVVSHTYYNTCAAGGVNASASDMGQWLRILMDEQPEVVGPEVLDAVFEPRIRTENERRIFRNWKGNKEAWYGYGWRIMKLGDETYQYHGGYVNHYRSELILNRQYKIGMCIVFNGATPLAKQCVPRFVEECKKAGLLPIEEEPAKIDM